MMLDVYNVYYTPLHWEADTGLEELINTSWVWFQALIKMASFWPFG